MLSQGSPQVQANPNFPTRLFRPLGELPWRCAEHDARVMEPRSQRHLLILFLSIFKEGTMVVSLHLPPIPGICTLLRAWAAATLKMNLNEREAPAWGTCAGKDGV